ncbi:MAG: hypothetical protein ACOYN2_04285 [Patescibacteria group bacterium]
MNEYFYIGVYTCALHGIDQKKFIAFYEATCIPLLVAELAYKYSMDSMSGIEFFIDWGNDMLTEYKSRQTLVGIIDGYPQITVDCPQFVKEIRKYHSRIPKKVQEELDFS